MGSITQPTAQMLVLAAAWEEEYSSAVFAGINGDASHQTRPGKHLSRSQNHDKFGANCWPIEHPKDKRGPSDKGCAIDMSMSKADMRRCHTNLRKIYVNRSTDPRAAFFYAFNGWDGEGSPGRYNFIQGTITVASQDHTWHEHGETFYEYVNSGQMVRAWVSALKGQTVEEYEGVDMADYTEAQMRAFAWQYVGGGIPLGMSTLGVLNEILLTVRKVAEKVDIDPAELEQIKAVVKQGVEESAQAIIDGVLEGLPEGTSQQVVEAVEQGVRNVLIKGTEEDVQV